MTWKATATAAAAVACSVLPLVVDGRFTVPVTATFEMSDAGAAHERFRAGSKFAKVVLSNGA